jgi:fructose-1,6-bisphosphatase
LPTILFLFGWRFFFYSNEKNEPVHIHCQKAEKDCKYWLEADNFDIITAYEYNISAADRRLLRKIIFENFEYILTEWKNYKKRK